MDQSLTKVDANWLKANAKMGIESIATEDLPIPYVSLTQTTSSKTFLEDGSLAPVGQFYYAATKKASPEFPCVLLKVEHKQVPKYNDRNQMEDAFVFVGATEGDWKPFMLACRGMSHGTAGRFIRDLKVRDEAPMFAYKVILKAKPIETKNGLKYLVNFTEALRSDQGEILFLKNLSDKMKGKALDGFDSEPEEVIEEPTTPPTENVNPDEIPF